MCFPPNWGWIHLALTFFVQNILWFLETRLVLAARHNIIVENLKEEDIIFGKFDVGDDFLLVNHILLLGKYYIYSQKCEKGMPSLQGFIARTRRNNNIELYIARKIGTLNNKHLSKREKSINIMWSPYNWILYINIKISTFYQLRCWSAVIVFFFFFFFFFAMRSSWISHSLGEMALNTPAKLADRPRMRVHAPSSSPFLPVSFYLFF